MKRRPIPWGRRRPPAKLLGYAALLCVLPLLLAQSCKDPDRPKPDEKFYCKVDGKTWRPDNDGDFKRITLVSDLVNGGKTLYIRATDAKNRQTVSMIIADTLGIDTTNFVRVYAIGTNTVFPNNPPAGYFSKPESKGSVTYIDYVTNDKIKGTFRILSVEHDRRVLNSFKMKAEFEFSAVSPSGEIVKITDGRFNNWVRIEQ